MQFDFGRWPRCDVVGEYLQFSPVDIFTFANVNNSHSAEIEPRFGVVDGHWQSVGEVFVQPCLELHRNAQGSD